MATVFIGTTKVALPDGTSAAPAITGTDTDSGMFFGTNIVGLATNGTSAVTVNPSLITTFNSTGALTLNIGTTAQRPTATTGQLRFSSSNTNLEYYNGAAWLGVTGERSGGTQKAIFGYGAIVILTVQSMTNLVSNTGVVAADVTGVGTARYALAAAGYGTDKAIFGYGSDGASVYYSLTNLVSNTGVVATNTTGVGTAREALAAAGYGGDKAIFGFGSTPTNVSLTNLVSNTGVVATDTTGVGTARETLAATGYSTDKVIFGYGYVAAVSSLTNLVSNVGVVATDTTGVGTDRFYLAAAGYST